MGGYVGGHAYVFIILFIRGGGFWFLNIKRVISLDLSRN